MYNWKWDFRKNDCLEYKQKHINSAQIKSTNNRCWFASALQFSLSIVKYTKLFQSNFRDVFHFSTRKTIFYCLLSLNFGAKLTHLCGFWLDVSFFSHLKKHRSRFWLDVSFFFKLLWLVRTHLHMKIYAIAFQWLYLSTYTLYRVDLTLYNKKGYVWSCAPLPSFPTVFFVSF